jgi:hypothetical protein
MTKALLVKANGEVTRIDLPEEDAHIMVHHKVGGWFDIVRHPTRPIHAYIHDEGLLLKQQPNVAVTYLFGQLLVGDIILSGATEDGSEGDFIVGDETIELYESCNTNESLVKQLEHLASTVDTTWKVSVE